ncbi:MAG: oxidoreductase [Pseudonocardiaceae bacterium]|nr:oxidoreductase [Pseudonocardiaceae bacterium]
MTTVQDRPHSEIPGDPKHVREALLARAQELVPLLREHAEAAARDRRLTGEVADALRAAGMFKLTAPRRVGGHEVNIRTYLEVCAELARGDGSAGWVTMLMNTGAYLMGQLSDRARDDVYGADPDAAVCGQLTPSATARPVDGGFVVTGRWAWASGSYWAQWSLPSIPLLDEQGELTDIRAALIPTTELAIEDTWFAAGMAATASNTFVAHEVFVPEHRTLSIFGMSAGVTRSEHTDEPLYRSASHTALTLANVGPLLGLAQAAFERVLEIVHRGKPIAYSTYERSIDSPSYQLNIADAAALIDTATLHAHRSADAIDTAAHDGVALDELTRARVRSDVATAATRCREAVSLLLNVGGASSFAQANPLQRIWRDLEIAARHGLVNVDLGREIYGRALLGITDQVSPMF